MIAGLFIGRYRGRSVWERGSRGGNGNLRLTPMCQGTAYLAFGQHFAKQIDAQNREPTLWWALVIMVLSGRTYRKGRAINSLITMALMMSMKKAPTMGTTRNAR